jgi:nitrite reductase/ring-hydroxylating ferredoxin subunit
MTRPPERPGREAGPGPTADAEKVIERRALLAGAGAVGLAATITPSRADAAAGATSRATTSGGLEIAGEYLIDTADVPLKGGVVFGAESGEPKVVVTHPRVDRFKCFRSVCTHQGCIVGEVRSNLITCFCHGSQFNARTGEVVTPPASDPLRPRRIKVRDGKIYLR